MLLWTVARNKQMTALDLTSSSQVSALRSCGAAVLGALAAAALPPSTL